MEKKRRYLATRSQKKKAGQKVRQKEKRKVPTWLASRFGWVATTGDLWPACGGNGGGDGDGF
jgi:hypothetical protein